MPWMTLSLNSLKPCGVKIAAAGCSHRARTSPSENEGLSLAGMVSRFFASREYSKWPLNANVSLLRQPPWVAVKVGRSRGVGGAPRLRPVFAWRHSFPPAPPFQLLFPLLWACAAPDPHEAALQAG